MLASPCPHWSLLYSCLRNECAYAFWCPSPVFKAALPWAHSDGCFAGLGVRLVLVVGCRQQVNELLEEQGVHAQHACGYRVTDAVAMQAVVQAAGSSRMEVEARLSKVRPGALQVCRSCAGSA